MFFPVTDNEDSLGKKRPIVPPVMDVELYQDNPDTTDTENQENNAAGASISAREKSVSVLFYPVNVVNFIKLFCNKTFSLCFAEG